MEWYYNIARFTPILQVAIRNLISITGGKCKACTNILAVDNEVVLIGAICLDARNLCRIGVCIARHRIKTLPFALALTIFELYACRRTEYRSRERGCTTRPSQHLV